MGDGDIKLARGWRISDVEKSLQEPSKGELVRFIKERYTERFFQPLHLLNSPEEGPGFAVMSLCCLLIETFQAYRTGLPSSNKGELERLQKEISDPPKPGGPYYIDSNEFPHDNGEPFRCFFTANQSFFPGVTGGPFYENIRNGLLHQSQTKRGWRINIGTGKLWDERARTVDRELFVRHLEMYFNAYLDELDKLDLDDATWQKARRKIWWLCQLSKR